MKSYVRSASSGLEILTSFVPNAILNLNFCKNDLEYLTYLCFLVIVCQKLEIFRRQKRNDSARTG